MGSHNQPEASDKYQRNYGVAVKALDSDSDNLDSTLNSLAVSWIKLAFNFANYVYTAYFLQSRYMPKDQFPGFSCYFGLGTHLSHNWSTQETPVRVCAPETTQQS